MFTLQRSLLATAFKHRVKVSITRLSDTLRIAERHLRFLNEDCNCVEKYKQTNNKSHNSNNKMLNAFFFYHFRLLFYILVLKSYSGLIWNTTVASKGAKKFRSGTFLATHRPTWWRNSPVVKLESGMPYNQLHGRTCTGPKPNNAATYLMQTLEPSWEASHRSSASKDWMLQTLYISTD